MTRARVILVVLDGAGVGEMPDAASYGDTGSNTLGNLARHVGGLHLPNLASMGLGNILPVEGVPPGALSGPGGWGKAGLLSPGKDTITGHWEIMGAVLERPLPCYPEGFPREVLDALEVATGHRFLANKAASGTEIIQEMGELHLTTGMPILYTSADSVLQLAAHEDVIPPEGLYQLCKLARGVLQGPHGVGRIIARPFVGTPGDFRRTQGRKDFPLPPPCDTVLDLLTKASCPVTGIGKIGDIFAMRGITLSIPTRENREGVEALAGFLQAGEGLCFANLIDFDMVYGHRNDSLGYMKALEEFDSFLGGFLEGLSPRDYLVVTADHGCDPTFPGTDHTREYVPLLVRGGKARASLGTRETLADTGAFIAEVFGLEWRGPGTSFLSDLGGVN